MFSEQKSCSIVTAVLPSTTAGKVIDQNIKANKGTALAWKARGTLLRDHWLSRFMPPIGPVKTVLKLIVPNSRVDSLVASIIETGRLHQQATGAVFSTPCAHAYFGSEFRQWSEGSEPGKAEHTVSESLSAITCNVGQTLSDKVARAAVEAGAHGPIIHFSEGRGLRDRVGWLRVTKEPLQETQLVITDESQADDVFDAMAKAAGFHLPGRGLMYRTKIDKGMFNLPSSYVKHRHDANLQQIISAIDHLSGHTHWRDQSVFALGNEGRIVGIDGYSGKHSEHVDRVVLTSLLKREQLGMLRDLMLDSGATGLTTTFGRFVSGDENDHNGIQIHDEHCLVKSVIHPTVAARICAIVDETAEQQGVRDLCVMVTPIERTATYVPSNIDYRNPEQRSVA